jgi:DNA-binding XRE family transcriptional regulator
MKLSESTLKKSQFIELRALEGKSLDEIAAELEVSKTTLIKWNKEFREEMDEMDQMRLRAMIARFNYGLDARTERLIKLSEKLLSEIETRNLAEVPTDKLIKLHLETVGKLEQMITQSEQLMREAAKENKDSTKEPITFRLAYSLD